MSEHAIGCTCNDDWMCGVCVEFNEELLSEMDTKLAAAKSRIAELEKQLAPLKKCVICINAHYFTERDPASVCRTCKDHSNWKGREG